VVNRPAISIDYLNRLQLLVHFDDARPFPTDIIVHSFSHCDQRRCDVDVVAKCETQSPTQKPGSQINSTIINHSIGQRQRLCHQRRRRKKSERSQSHGWKRWPIFDQSAEKKHISPFKSLSNSYNLESYHFQPFVSTQSSSTLSHHPPRHISSPSISTGLHLIS
jgi:hypothetical protein